MDGIELQQEYLGMPPVTKTYLFGCIAVTLLLVSIEPSVKYSHRATATTVAAQIFPNKTQKITWAVPLAREYTV